MIDPAHLERLGVYFDDATQQYMRHRLRVANVEYDESDPKAVDKGLVTGYDEELVPFPVVLPLATDKRSIDEAQAKAAQLGHDFYHPQYGWLRWGKKREIDHDENLGSGATQYERRRVTVAAPKKGK